VFFSTHNDSSYLSPEKIGRARDLNLILGSKYVVMAFVRTETGLGRLEGQSRIR